MAYITRKDGSWLARISWQDLKTWKKDKEGNLYHPRRQKSKQGFKTAESAKFWAKSEELKIMQGFDILKNPSLVEYYDYWFDTYKKSNIKSYATRKKYDLIRKYIFEFFGNQKLKEIDRGRYQQFINNFGSNHAPVRVRMTNSTIRSCIQSAMQDQIITTDFTRYVTLVYDESKKRKVKYISINEMEELINLAKDNLDPKYTATYMILTAFYTGARLGEIAALEWKDIDFDKGLLSISKSWDYKKKQNGRTKNEHSIRTIKVNDSLLAILKGLKINNMLKVFGRPSNGLPPSSNGVNHRLRYLLKKAKIHAPGYHFHSIRHTHVAFLLSKGIPIESISKRLGHASISITLDTYAYLIDEFANENNEKIIFALDKLDKKYNLDKLPNPNFYKYLVNRSIEQEKIENY